MRTFHIAAALISLSFPALAGGSHRVQGYTRQDGTYVEPHYQTNPDGNKANNWSAEGNSNPYTGQAGTVDPYQAPNYNAPSYAPPNRSSSYRPRH